MHFVDRASSIMLQLFLPELLTIIKVYKFSENLPYKLLSHARRVVMAFPVNHEFDMTEIRYDATWKPHLNMMAISLPNTS